MPIDRIRIQAVRGIRKELTLELGGGSLVLRGDNGTGKSSIVAGLLWGLRGEQAPSGSAKAGTEEAYRANVLDGWSAAQVSIDLKGGGSLKVTPTKLDADEKGAALRDKCERSSPFLLRRQLLRFLDDRPVDRFHYLEGFLDLETADQTREVLQSRSRQYEGTAETHRSTLSQHLTLVLSALPADLRPSAPTWTPVVDALVTWAARLNVPSASRSWADVVALGARLAPLLKGENLARARLTLENARSRWEEIGSPPSDPADYLLKLQAALVNAVDADLSTLLAEAAKHFAAHTNAASCPVCRQGIDASVVQEVQLRLTGLKELQAAREDLAATGTSWKKFWNSLQVAVRAYGDARKIQFSEEDSQAPQGPVGMSDLALQVGADKFAETVARIGAVKISAWAVEIDAHARRWIENELAGLPAEDNTDEIRSLIQAIEYAQKVEFPVALAESSATDDDARGRRFKLVAEAIRSARQDVARELLDEISTLVGEFYTFVHPVDADDEVTGAPEIEVQRRAGGTAHLRGKFDKKDVDDPRWVYSDGHLDTVGICVFLALRRFRADRDKQGDPRLMILDDIVLSVDLAHGRRLLDLLRGRFADHQVLIFTHNGLFCDWCAQRLPTYKRKVISRWTLDTGPQLGEYLSSLEYIEQQIAESTSPKLLAQAVMNLMDEWLADARFAYSLPVQAKRGEEYTLTEIWEPFCKRLASIEKALKAPLGRLTRLLDELQDLPKMRNRLAAHETEFAHEYPLSAVRDTAKRAVELVRLLYCPECTNFAIPIPNPQSPDLVRCDQKCDRIRYDRPSKQIKSSSSTEPR